MKLPWVETKIADQILAQLQTQIKAHERYSLRIYDSVASALTEASRGLTQLYSDQFSIAIVSGNNPYLSSIPEFFSRMGYKVQSIPYFQAHANTDWIEKLSADTTFVLFAEDHPFTNETWDWDLSIKALGEKKIFSIVLSQSLFRQAPKTLEHEAWLIRIHELDPRKVIGFFGSRSKKIERHLFANVPWTQKDLEDFLVPVRPLIEKPQEIKSFETNLPTAFTAFFKTAQTRIYDRAVFFVHGLSGDAFVKYLQQKHAKLQITTANLCSWPYLETLDWWQDQTYLPEKIQSLVAVDAANLTLELIEEFSKAYENILQMQKVK